MTVLFLVTDPRGLKIECYEGRLNYIFDNKHPELDKEHITIEDIEDAIKHPRDSKIFLSTTKAHKGKYLYYKEMPGRIYDLLVVVKFDGDDCGVVDDVYPCSSRTLKEQIIWPKTKR